MMMVVVLVEDKMQHITNMYICTRKRKEVIMPAPILSNAHSTTVVSYVPDHRARARVYFIAY